MLRGKLLSPERRRGTVEHARRKDGLSERQACRILKQWRGTQPYLPMVRTDEEALTEAIIALSSEYGHYGYRWIIARLQEAGWQVGKDRVQRIWRREGLKAPQKQRPRRSDHIAKIKSHSHCSSKKLESLKINQRNSR